VSARLTALPQQLALDLFTELRRSRACRFKTTELWCPALRTLNVCVSTITMGEIHTPVTKT
jgi:hypothetical protein